MTPKTVPSCGGTRPPPNTWLFRLVPTSPHPQTTTHSVQPFLQRSQSWQTDTQTDHATVGQEATSYFFIYLTHTHTRLTALCLGLPGWAGTRKVKPIWILLKQDTVSGSGIRWAICMSAHCSRETTMPATNCSVLQAGCPSCLPTNSIKALKALFTHLQTQTIKTQ